jgi:ABC-type glycerol-3-phosphate transport system substrate-binding protein
VDQGGKFYDEKTNKWSWQTTEAERAFQWILDLYDKYNVAWRKQPDGIKDAMGEARSAMIIHGAYALSNYAKQYPDVPLQDQPMPGFVPGKTPNYYEHEIAGYALSALLKPDDAKAKIGATFIKDLLSPEGARALANEYSGAILNYDVYTHPDFRKTKFAELRTDFVEKVIKRMFLPAPAASPGVGAQWTKVLNGQLGIPAMLAELQQIHQTAEDEALRGRG